MSILSFVSLDDQGLRSPGQESLDTVEIGVMKSQKLKSDSDHTANTCSESTVKVHSNNCIPL